MKRVRRTPLLLLLFLVIPLGGLFAFLYKKSLPSAATEYQRGKDLVAISMLVEAKDAYEQAIRLDPNYAPAYRGLAELATTQGNSEAAISYWKELLKHDPKAEHVWCRLGQAEALSGLEAPALEDGKKELELTPLCPRANLLLGVLYARQNASKLALDHLQIAAEANKDTPQIQLVYGRVLALVGDYDRAETVLKSTLGRESGQPDPYIWLGYVYAHRVASPDNRRQAKNYLRQALAIDPDRAEANFELGRIMTQERRYAEALPLLKKAVTGKRHYIAALQVLAQNFTALGQKTDAEAVMKAFQRESELLAREKVLLKQYVVNPADLETKMALVNLELERNEPQAALIFLLSIQKSNPTDPRIAPAMTRLDKMRSEQQAKGASPKDNLQDALTGGK